MIRSSIYHSYCENQEGADFFASVKKMSPLALISLPNINGICLTCMQRAKIGLPHISL